MLTSIIYRPTLNRNNHTGRDGKRTVVISIYQTGTKLRTSITTHIRVKATDFANGKVQPSEPNHDLFNRKIKRMVRRLMEFEDELEGRGQQPTPRSIREGVEQHLTCTATIGEFVESVIDGSDRQPQTKAAYHYLANVINDMRPGTTISDISYDFVERWRTGMRSQGLSENTIKGRLKQLHCLTQEAIKRGVISDDPFKFITIGNMTPKRGYLTLTEIRRLERLSLSGKEEKIRDLFLLGCYTGLRWSDLTTIHEAAINKGILRKQMYKTHLEVVIPVSTLFWGRGLDILSRYPGTELANICCNSTANRIIADLASRAGIKKHVTFHLARKSFASNLSLLGLPLQEIAVAMGHTKTDVTNKHYLFTKAESLAKISKKLFKRKN